MKRAAALALFLAAASLAAQATSSARQFHIRPVTIFGEHLYEGQLSNPMGVAFDAKANEVWVADTQNSLLGAFTPDGVPLFAFGSDDMLEPVRVATDANGRLYVLDHDRTAVKVYSYKGDPLGKLALPGLGEKPIIGTIAMDAEGNLYVGENESCQVLVYGPDFKPRQRFGSCGVEEGQFQSITGIAVDANRIVVTDAQGISVQVFDKHGDFVRGWGRHDMGRENFSLPSSVALLSDGRVVVIDTLRHEIKFFDAEGQFLDRFGGIGWRLGQIAFPVGVAVDPAGRLYVLEKGNQRVQAFVVVAGDFPRDAMDMNRNNGPQGQVSIGKEVPRISPTAGTSSGFSTGSLQQPLGGNR
jgi:DNA-binding beta-propeller fold protein YncE